MARHLISPVWLKGMMQIDDEEDDDNDVCPRVGRGSRQRSWEGSHSTCVLDSQAAIARN